MAEKRNLAPLSIVAATTRIHGGVEMELTSTKQVDARPGQEVQLHHVYELEEASKEQEEYRFALESRQGTARKKPVLVRFGDKWGVPDSARGAVHHSFKMDKPGAYTLTFEAYAEYAKFDRGSHEVHQWDRVTKAGTIKVVVE